MIVSGCTFSLTAKEKVPKRKLAAGSCCYESAVVGQGQCLPQHYQCCIGEGYLSVVVVSDRMIGRHQRGGLTETRAMRWHCAEKHFSVLIFWQLLDQAKSG